jgi:hypothetical protein
MLPDGSFARLSVSKMLTPRTIDIDEPLARRARTGAGNASDGDDR